MKGDRENRPLVIVDIDAVVRAAIDGLGLAVSLEQHVSPHLSSGALIRVLEDWCPPFAGFFLYYPADDNSQPPWPC